MAHGVTPSFNANPLDAMEWDGFDYLVPDVDKVVPNARHPQGLATIDALKLLAKV